MKVGILDADIYGPSQPKLFGLRGKPRLIEGRKLEPMERFGVKVMSIGFLVEEDLAMIWRGPMVISAITQMLREVVWGDLDVLVVDLPPDTGDAQLTMAQQTPLAGGDRRHPAGHRADRYTARHRHAAACQCAFARHDREHVELLLPRLQPRDLDLRSWWRAEGGGKA